MELWNDFVGFVSFLDCCASRVSFRFRRGGNDYVLSLRVCVFDMLDTIASARSLRLFFGCFFWLSAYMLFFFFFRDKGRAGVRMSVCLFVQLGFREASGL